MFTDRIPHVIAALGVAASALVAGSAAAVAERHRPCPDLGSVETRAPPSPPVISFDAWNE